jgi:hypothetical protein
MLTPRRSSGLELAQQVDRATTRYTVLHRISAHIGGACRYPPSARLTPEIQNLDSGVVQ